MVSLDEERAALHDVLARELEKLRRLSSGTSECLGSGEWKALEALARIFKLLERSQPAEGGTPQEWSAEAINQVMDRGQASLSVVPAPTPDGRNTPPGDEGRWDNEADEAFRDLHLP